MASIKKIQDSITQLTTFLEEYNAAYKIAPDNFSLQLAINSIKGQLTELQQQLYKENLKRATEIIELRFIGNAARFGSLPLLMVGGLTDSFSNAIFEASKYFQFGKKGGKKIEQMINQTIDLRLEEIGKGSTIFYLSAKTSPDLFGNSVIQNTLDHTFELLNSETAEDIINNIPTVGSQSIKHYSNFFKELTADNLSIDITWHTPNEEIKIWRGSRERILSLYNTLNTIQLREPEEINFEGKVITLSLKGKFEILTIYDERLFGTYPNELTDTIKQLHVGDNCKGIIIKTTIYNPATEKEKYEYTLKEIISEG